MAKFKVGDKVVFSDVRKDFDILGIYDDKEHEVVSITSDNKYVLNDYFRMFCEFELEFAVDKEALKNTINKKKAKAMEMVRKTAKIVAEIEELEKNLEALNEH